MKNYGRAQKSHKPLINHKCHPNNGASHWTTTKSRTSWTFMTPKTARLQSFNTNLRLKGECCERHCRTRSLATEAGGKARFSQQQQRQRRWWRQRRRWNRRNDLIRAKLVSDGVHQTAITFTTPPRFTVVCLGGLAATLVVSLKPIIQVYDHIKVKMVCN